MLTQILRRLAALLILCLAIYGLIKLVTRSGSEAVKSVTQTIVLSPVSKGELLSRFKLITVERQYRIPVMGTTFKPMPSATSDGVAGEISQMVFGQRERVPGTTRNLVYEMVTTVTAGIDMAKMQEGDIINSGAETTVTLPKPEVLSVAYDSTESRIFSQDSPTIPYVSDSAELLTDMQRTGEAKHRAEAEADEALMSRARLNAEQSLHDLLGRTHPGRNIHIRFAE